ncbi:MAG: AMP-binding protein [Chloroflexota bacterium]
MIPLPYATITEPVIQRARERPNQLCLVFINDDGSETAITTAEFHRRSVRYARALQAAGVQPDDLVVLVLRHSQTLLYAFWGALYLGAVASIFPFLTEKLDPELYRQRVKELVSHSQARAVITFPEFKQPLQELLAGAGCQVLSTAEISEAGPGEDTLALAGQAGRLAFLQHSSGTTGLQKGVALTHQAVLNQVQAYSQAIGLTGDDRIVSWLPLYHDMGLIAGFVMPLVAGTPLVLMSPFKWVRDPKALFQAITRHRATLCWQPNFAYNHAARVVRPAGLVGVDLSSLRAWINCSEPVFHDSHQVFLQAFAGCGVRPEALSTCYAMAENTFAVTQQPSGQAPRLDWVQTAALQAQRLALPAQAGAAGASIVVSCGRPIPGTEVQVCDAGGQTLPERQVGEIALRSSCMLDGYYRRPELSAEAIRDGWYFTGDMGYLAEGELFITGRKKDLIIVGGKNIYPQDLEAIANLTPGLLPGRCAAFGLLDPKLGSENIVMVCEVEDPQASEEQLAEIEKELRRRIVQRSEVAVSDIRLVEKGWVIKTSSGKISRASNREKYLRSFFPGAA